MPGKKINLNSLVKFELTPHGKNIWNEFWQPYTGLTPKGKSPTKEQIWTLMMVFGPHTHMTATNIFENLEWELEEDEHKS